VIVEAKALSEIAGAHRAQTIYCLKATQMNRGLLINFGMPSLRYERWVWNYQFECVRSANRSGSGGWCHRRSGTTVNQTV
jgi:hypothetical protein